LERLNTFNSYVQNVQPITHFTQVLNPFDGATKGRGSPNQKYTIQGSQHCELTFALHFIKTPRAHSGGEIKIGCSKASCYWYHIFLSMETPVPHTRQIALTLLTYDALAKPSRMVQMPFESRHSIRCTLANNDAYLKIGTHNRHAVWASLNAHVLPGSSVVWSLRTTAFENGLQIYTLRKACT